MAPILLSTQGARDYQEDTVACVATPTALAGGVFDGHGGDDVSGDWGHMLGVCVCVCVCWGMV